MKCGECEHWGKSSCPEWRSVSKTHPACAPMLAVTRLNASVKRLISALDSTTEDLYDMTESRDVFKADMHRLRDLFIESGSEVTRLRVEVKRLRTFGVLLHASVARVFKGE
jgi:hypothetical protein